MSFLIRSRRGVVVVTALGSLLLTGCGDDSTVKDTGASAATSADDAGAGSAGDETSVASGWTTAELTDVSGEAFTIADLAGKPVFVENFATWCSNCLRQPRRHPEGRGPRPATRRCSWP